MLAIASGRQKGMEKMSPAVKNFNIDGVVLAENIQDQVLRDAVERCIEAGFIKPVNQAGVLVLISKSIDDYIEHRITADKTIEGILKDIQSNTATIAEKKIP
jgi:hypothetical protein